MPMSDLTLLQRWMERRDAEAFAEIVSRHAAMVYGTCRRVLGSASDAEDVAQDCFLRLAQAHTPPRTSLAGWLHTLATHRSLDRVKADARRRGREIRYVTDITDRAQPEWDDIQPLVDEAIAALPEKLRYPIVAHFLEGETHMAIAETLGVNQSTATRRVQRGVAALRSSLQQRGVPVATGALATALAAEAVEAVPATLAPKLGKVALTGARTATPAAVAKGMGIAGGLLAMKKSVATVAVILAILLGLLLYNNATRNGEPSSVSVRVSPTPTDAPSTPPQKTLSAAEPHQAATAPQDAPELETPLPAAIGQPLPTLASSHEESLEHGEIADPALYVSISGYVLDKESGAPVGGATVMAMASGFEADETMGSRNEASMLDAILDARHHFITTSRHDGFYHVEGIRFSGFVMMMAQAKGFAQDSEDLYSGLVEAKPGDRQSDVNILLSPGDRLNGRVITDDDRPVTDAVVCQMAYMRIAHTDGDGHFTLAYCLNDHTEPDNEVRTIDLTVRSRTHGQTAFEDVPVVPGEEVELRMKAPASLSGTITRADGTPANGLKVWIIARHPWTNRTTNSSENDQAQFEAVVDESGNYHIASVNAGLAYNARVLDGNNKPLSQAVELPTFEPEEHQTWDYALKDLITIRGRLHGAPSGAPLSSYFVVCEKAEDTPVQAQATKPGFGNTPTRDVGRCQTAPDGSYELSLSTGEGEYFVYPIPWEPTFTRPNEYIEKVLAPHSHTLSLEAGEERDLDLSLPDPVTISARLVDPNGTPIEVPHRGCVRWWAKVPGEPVPTAGGLRAEFGPGGLMYWSRFAPGLECWLTFDDDDTYFPSETKRRTGHPGQVFPEETLVVYRRSGVEGIAVDENGEPFANTRLRVEATYGDGKEAGDSVTTDAQGRFCVRKHIPATAATIAIETRLPAVNGHRPFYRWTSGEPLEFVADHITMLGEIVLMLDQ